MDTTFKELVSKGFPKSIIEAAKTKMEFEDACCRAGFINTVYKFELQDYYEAQEKQTPDLSNYRWGQSFYLMNLFCNRSLGAV